MQRVNAAVKKRSTVGMGCLILFVIGAIGAAISGADKNGGAGQTASDTNATSPNSSADEKAQSKRAAIAGLAVASLKNALRDPDSFKLERAFTTMDAKYACILYRARNGFGGMNRDHVVFTERGGDQTTHGWNKHCVKGEFSEQTPNAETLASYVNGTR